MTLITDEYKALQTQLHEERPDYGTSSQKHIEQIRAIAQQLGTRDIIDYGCGKCQLQKGLPFPIQNYDPCLTEWSRHPDPADLVVCTDVLEHIEPQCLDEVLDDLAALTKKLLLVEVACRPAKKWLADGRNAHLIQQKPNWWLKHLLNRFDLYQFQSAPGAFVALLTPFDKPAQPQGDDHGKADHQGT